MTLTPSYTKNKFSTTEQALSDVASLLSSLTKSRKAPMRLKEITDLTNALARLSRSLHLPIADQDDSDGYGDPDHYTKISAPSKSSDLIR